MLPPGVHEASLSEVERRFGTSDRRRELLDGIRRGCEELRAAGCTVVYLDGSYVTDKPVPGDFDLCWDPTDVDAEKIDPVLLDFSDRRKRQKLKYGGEFFPSSARADGSRTFVDFFQIDKHTGKQKGLLRIRLR